MTASASSDFAALVQEFFLERLISQCNASACTVASYRDTFRLLLAYAEQRLHKPPTRMTFADLDTELVLGFLNHIEKERGNSPRTRNLRLTAVRSFAKYACCRDPTVLPTAQRLLAIPTKRFDQTMVGYLSREEVEAILAAPVAHTWSGRRDRVMFATLYNTGARVSEIVAARLKDLMLDGSPLSDPLIFQVRVGA